MPGELSPYGAQIALDFATGKVPAFTVAVPTYLALLTVAPDDTTTMANMVEVTTPGYARPACSWTGASLASPSVTANAALISFGALTADMTLPAVGLVLVTAQTGTTGQVRMWWTLDQAMQLLNGQTLQISANVLTMSQT